MDKKSLSETDIISKYIMPAVQNAGWDLMTQIRQEVKLRDGKVIVRGQLGVRKTVKSADIVLYHQPNIPLAVIEAKANKHEVGKGIQQGLDYWKYPLCFHLTAMGLSFTTRPTQINSKHRFNYQTFPRQSSFGKSIVNFVDSQQHNYH